MTLEKASVFSFYVIYNNNIELSANANSANVLFLR